MIEFNPEPRRRVIRRRMITIPRSILALVVLITLAPITVPLALAVDSIRWLVRRQPAMTTRLMALGFVFFATELIGLWRLLLSWIRAGWGRDRSRLRAEAWPIQIWWARTLFRAVLRVFAIDLIVSGQKSASPGPVIAMFRHASIVDNLLPAVLLTADLGIRLRWVVKRELLTLPSLDVAGKRLPNYFVDREAADVRQELRGIKALAADLDDDEGVLIFPEGTRFTSQRRLRALKRMRQAGDAMAERAAGLEFLMPPRPGGTLALLDSGADVVVGVHQGLEGFAKLGDLWSGELVGRTVAVRLTRIDAAAIPRGRKERVDWLYDLWAELDSWIAAQVGS